MDIIPNRLYDSLKLLNLRPAVCILIKKTVILNACLIVGKISAEQRTRSAWSVRPAQFENRLNCCEMRNVDNDTNNKDDSYV